MSRVALVTTGDVVLSGHDVDLEPVRTTLQAMGIDVATTVWDDSSVDWPAHDLVLMRCPWDYSERLEEFLTWMDAVPVPLLNPPAVIRWNLDKAYLLELEARGVAIVPTTLCHDLDDVEHAVASLSDADHVVLKPTVSAGSRDTELLPRTSARVRQLSEHILALGKVVMVQPAIPSVQERGEVACLYFDGVYSHAVRKGPLLAPGGGLLGGEYTEVIEPVVPTSEVRALGDRAVAAVTAFCHERLGVAEPLLYARLDIVDGPRGPLVLEAELFEPSYFLDGAPGAVERFGDAVARRLG